MTDLTTDVLVIGGGTGGTAAAIQAARRGADVILVSEFEWLGGMLTAAGVAAPDGNELLPFQTGIWGAFLRELERRQPGGLDHAWVSFFTYEPAIAAQIFADWVAELPNLRWIKGQTPVALLRQDQTGSQMTGAQFQDCTIQAHITLDATELGDGLALGQVPWNWGWDLSLHPPEISLAYAQQAENFPDLVRQYPVQAVTWVVVMQDFGEGQIAPAIPQPPNYDPICYEGAWQDYGPERFLNYGRLPGDRFMINWPCRGNDYGVGLDRLIQSPQGRAEFWQEAYWHAQGFAHYIQTQLGRR